ncbi:MAG: hypothetical protein R2713_07630 [Ilumatobacteraceae bacterium]
MFIGLSVTNGEAAQAAAFPLLAPLTFASGAVRRPGHHAGLARVVEARRQPLSKTTEAVRADVGRTDRRPGDGLDRLVARDPGGDVPAGDRQVPPGVNRSLSW